MEGLSGWSVASKGAGGEDEASCRALCGLLRWEGGIIQDDVQGYDWQTLHLRKAPSQLEGEFTGGEMWEEKERSVGR